MPNTITNPKTLRRAKRKAQASLDAVMYQASNGFNGCSTKRVCESKQFGAHHKKLFMERTTKHYKTFSNS